MRADEKDLVRSGSPCSLRHDVGECLSLRFKLLTPGRVAARLELPFDELRGATKRGIVIDVPCADFIRKLMAHGFQALEPVRASGRHFRAFFGRPSRGHFRSLL